MPSLFQKFTQRFVGREPETRVIFDDGGVSLFVESDLKWNFAWASVREVFAYKDDLGTYDEICLGFRFDDAGSCWRVDEECIGYQQLLDELPRRFPGIRTEWWREVAFPAFVANRTTLWTAHGFSVTRLGIAHR
jgi:hypothetical protein